MGARASGGKSLCRNALQRPTRHLNGADRRCPGWGGGELQARGGEVSQARSLPDRVAKQGSRQENGPGAARICRRPRPASGVGAPSERDRRLAAERAWANRPPRSCRGEAAPGPQPGPAAGRSRSGSVFGTRAHRGFTPFVPPTSSDSRRELFPVSVQYPLPR